MILLLDKTCKESNIVLNYCIKNDIDVITYFKGEEDWGDLDIFIPNKLPALIYENITCIGSDAILDLLREKL